MKFKACLIHARFQVELIDGARAQKRTDGYDGVRTPASSVYMIGDVIMTPNTVLSIRFGMNVIELI